MRKLKITEMGRMNAAEFKASEKMPLVVVLDDVRSMYNVGSVFRTADAFRVEAIYLCGITACPPHPEIHKTALGAEDTVAWRHFATALEAVQQLKEQGYTVFSTEQCEGSTMLQALELGITVIKFFPSHIYGGLKAMKALSGPFPQVKFIPTGGVDKNNIDEYLAWDKIYAVGGSSFVKEALENLEEK